MKFRSCSAWRAARVTAAVLAAMFVASPSLASEFSVSPVRVELKPGALSETIAVTNHAKTRLRVAVKLMEWTQDAQGNDVYKENADLVYFPRQLELEPESKRLVRVGAKAPAGPTERTYRLFIEEQPEAAADGSRAQISFYFRFGVPVFLTPAVPKPQPEVAQPTLDHGKVAVSVRNSGNQHFRLLKVSMTDGAGFAKEIPGWYSLTGTERTYSMDLPREVCRKGGVLAVVLEGEGLRVDRKLDVDPARCV